MTSAEQPAEKSCNCGRAWHPNPHSASCPMHHQPQAAKLALDVARAEGAGAIYRAVMGVLEPLGDPRDPTHLHPQAASLIVRVCDAMRSADLTTPPESRAT